MTPQVGFATRLDERRGHGEFVFQRVVGGDERRVLHPLLGDLLDGNELAHHFTSFARRRGVAISRRAVFCVFFTNTFPVWPPVCWRIDSMTPISRWVEL